MKEMVTVTRVGDAIRVSKVTAHGEEILEADAEARFLGILLWKKLSEGDPDGGVPLLPWSMIEQEFSKLTRAIQELSERITDHKGAMKEFQAQTTLKKPTPVIRGQ